MKRLIVTADDFGISMAVNAAVEGAHRNGILSAASLMVAGEAASDAVARAKAMSGLGVGLHLVLVDGKPVLPPERLPALVDRRGQFPNDPVRLGIKLQFSATARRQAEAEMRAQFDAFRATGLPLDHVNAHHHFHFHPAVRDLLLRLAPEYRVRAIRVPREAGFSMLTPFALALRRRLVRDRIAHNDWQIGIRDTGRMDKAALARHLASLPEGVTEIYSHPAIGNDEYAALIDPEIVALVKQFGVTPIPFRGLPYLTLSTR